MSLFRTVVVDGFSLNILPHPVTGEGVVCFEDVCNIFGIDTPLARDSYNAKSNNITDVALLVNGDAIKVSVLPILNITNFLTNTETSVLKGVETLNLTNIPIIEQTLTLNFIKEFRRHPSLEAVNRQPTVTDLMVMNAQAMLTINKNDNNEVLRVMKELPKLIAQATVNKMYCGPREFFGHEPVAATFPSPEGLKYLEKRTYINDLVNWYACRWAISESVAYPHKKIWNYIYYTIWLEFDGFNPWQTGKAFLKEFRVKGKKSKIKALEALGWSDIIADMAYKLYCTSKDFVITTPERTVNNMLYREEGVKLEFVGPYTGFDLDGLIRRKSNQKKETIKTVERNVDNYKNNGKKPKSKLTDDINNLKDLISV